jgi:hypothetical protein
VSTWIRNEEDEDHSLEVEFKLSDLDLQLFDLDLLSIPASVC